MVKIEKQEILWRHIAKPFSVGGNFAKPTVPNKINRQIMIKLYRLLFFLNFTLLFTACNGQKNPDYIGQKFGTFDLDKIKFDENLDTLFSKVSKADLILIIGKYSYFDTIQKKQIWTDTVEDYIYRIPHAKIEGLYSFKNFKIKNKVVSFYADNQKRFRRVDFSINMTEKEYANLIGKSKDYKDITTDQIRKFNNGKYIILEKIDGAKKTLLYCTETKNEDGDYFVRVRMNDLKIKDDAFDRQHNSKWGY